MSSSGKTTLPGQAHDPAEQIHHGGVASTAPRPLCLVSACLCGVACRYDGGTSLVERLAHLSDSGLALAICPEVDGGLPTPRPPCELRAGRAVTREGADLTQHFEAGAAHALELAHTHGIRLAILKENSPSCGGTMVYDGGFSGTRVPGQGIAAALLRRYNIRVVSEHGCQDALEQLLRRGNPLA